MMSSACGVFQACRRGADSAPCILLVLSSDVTYWIDSLATVQGDGVMAFITQSLITPDQLTASAGSDELTQPPAASTSLLPDVLQPTVQMQRASALMSHLGSHLEAYSSLSQSMSQAIGSAVHPHAIDGTKLAKLLLQPLGSSDDAAAGGVGAGVAASGGAAQVQQVDVGSVLDGWVDQLEACAPAIGALTSGPGGEWLHYPHIAVSCM